MVYVAPPCVTALLTPTSTVRYLSLERWAPRKEAHPPNSPEVQSLSVKLFAIFFSSIMSTGWTILFSAYAFASKESSSSSSSGW